jgi:O-antigen ligase
MSTTNFQLPRATRNRARFKGAIWLVGLAAASVLLLLALLANRAISSDALAVIAATAFFSVLLFVEMSIARASSTDSTKSFFRLTLVVWFFMLSSEQILYHNTLAETAMEGSFGSEAYGEAAMWGIALLVLVFLISFRAHILRNIFSGSYKWISLFALLAVASVPLSPGPLYSLGWASKLLIVVLLLHTFANSIQNDRDIAAFLSACLAGVFLITLARVSRPFVEPGSAFEGGRLNDYAGPTGLSVLAGILLLLSMTLFAVRKRGWLVPMGAYAILTMMFAGGKAGILAGIVSAILFLLLQRQGRKALGMLVGFLVIGAILLATTPLGKYLQDYSRSAGASTITGRSVLWSIVLPAVLEKPIVGHGYAASRFLSVELKGTFPDTGHTHNSFLEASYNNGIVGLFIILAMNWIIVRNLLKAMRNPWSHEGSCLTIGALVIYINLLINGMFKVTFGGLPDSDFMIFLALVVVSIKLRDFSERTSEGATSQ